MTPENLQENVRLERKRGREALREAEALLAADLPYGAATRADYAAFHLARGLGLIAGEEPRTHQGVAHFLNLHYVRTGKLKSDMNRRYAALQTFRENADYQVGSIIDLEMARFAVEDATAFVARCEQLIQELLPSVGGTE